LDGLILAVLEQGPGHGYAIMEMLQERSGGVFDLPTGSLYPALRRLERAGYVRSEWNTVGGRQRRTYQLTAAGRTVLGTQRSEWRSFSALIDGVLRPGPKAGPAVR
jgi:DNA-binding PadR family transcriptional regulator